VITGIDFDLTKFGENGSWLKKQIRGCGILTKWHFETITQDSRPMWIASGCLPIGTCVGRAVVSAGGKDHDACFGLG